MSRLVMGFVVLLGLGAWAPGVQAQVQATVTATDSAQQALRASLRVLNGLQEVHYSQHTTYTRDLEALRALPGGARLPDGVTLEVVFASDRGHGTVATHTLLPGQSCVMWIGDVSQLPQLVTADKRLNGVERPGRATCDFDAPGA